MKTIKTVLATALAVSGLAHAAVSPEEAKQLGATLTPWGALKAGNKEGTIPAYDGGLPVTTAPPGFKKNSGHWADPFASEKPLYSITAANMANYADKLGEVTKEMLKRFPTYRVDVYPTHRVVNYPESFIDNSIKNATRCKTIEDGLAVSNCIGGTPFPIPKTGNEAMWNIELTYAKSFEGEFEVVYVDAGGTPVVAARQYALFKNNYYDPKTTMDSLYKSGAFYFKGGGVQLYPPRIAGDGTLAWYTLNPVENSNKGWNYQQGNRRVRAIPDAQYDYPILVSGGAQFFDEIGLFLGKQDRFDFKLLGTKEMIIPYSTYRAVETSKEDMTSVGGGHYPNPSAMRWELHRVRVIEATLKPGLRHAFAKRVFYSDEDLPGAGMADSWDHAGKPYKGYFTLFSWEYDVQNAYTKSSLEYDLATGIWYLGEQMAGQPGVKVRDSIPESEMSPEAMARRSQR